MKFLSVNNALVSEFLFFSFSFFLKFFVEVLTNGNSFFFSPCPPLVATGFPAGQTHLKTRLEEIRLAVEDGAMEIDVVINRTLVLTGQWEGRCVSFPKRGHSSSLVGHGEDPWHVWEVTESRLRVIGSEGESRRKHG